MTHHVQPAQPAQPHGAPPTAAAAASTPEPTTPEHTTPEHTTHSPTTSAGPGRSTSAQFGPRSRALRRAVLALALGGFAIGVTEFSMMGLLSEAAADLGVGLPDAGLLVSAYALGAVIGGPVLSIVFAWVERRRLVFAMLALFIGGHLLSLFAGGMTTLLAGRFISGLPHGAYLATAALIIGRLVGPGKRAQAASWVLAGLTVANVAGVPLVTWLGQFYGWQWMFGVALAVAAVTVVLVLLWVPSERDLPRPAGGAASMRRELAALAIPQVWAGIAVAVVGFSGLFALYAYISPVMTEVAGLPQRALPFVLALYGIGMVVGTLIGGRAADRSVLGTLRVGLSVLAGSLVLFAATVQILPIAVLLVVLVAISGSMLGPALQAHLMDCAPKAPQVAASLMHSSFNLANAFGAWVGGFAISQGLGLRAPSLVGALTAAIGVALVLAIGWAAQRRIARRAVYA